MPSIELPRSADDMLTAALQEQKRAALTVSMTVYSMLPCYICNNEVPPMPDAVGIYATALERLAAGHI